jgi:hypothetical protein
MEDIEKKISFTEEKLEELKEQSTVMKKNFQASTPVNPTAKITSDRDSGVGTTRLSTEVYKAMADKPRKRKDMPELTDNGNRGLRYSSSARLRMECARDSLADKSSLKLS